MKKVLVAALAALTLAGCATASTGPNMYALHYKGGALTAKKFVNCLDPSNRSGWNPGDNYIGYPTRQVSFDATGGRRAEADAFQVVSSDSVVLSVPVTVTFRLVAQCETLRKMHETVGSRYAAGFDPNGEVSDPPDGWGDMLNFVIGKPLDAVLDRVAQEYKWRRLWTDPKVKARLERDVSATLPTLVDRQAGGHFFEDFSVLVQKPDPGERLVATVLDEQDKISKARADEAAAVADAARARAQLELERATAANQRQAILGYRLPGMTAKEALRAYNEAQLIAHDGNPWQPTYVIGGTAPTQ